MEDQPEAVPFTCPDRHNVGKKRLFFPVVAERNGENAFVDCFVPNGI